jgi:hypothetical protein
MAKQKQVRLDIPTEVAYGRDRAKHLLKLCKERDAKLHLVPVRIDKNTIRLMTKENAEKYLKQKKNEN